MRIAIGADHGGYPLNERVIKELAAAEHEIIDIGILICGSGVGAAVAANKLNGIRAALCGDTYSGHQSREHDDCNVLCLGARVVGEELAMDIVHAFVTAKFTGEERHRRRVAKVADIEKNERA